MQHTKFKKKLNPFFHSAAREETISCFSAAFRQIDVSSIDRE